MRSLVDGWLGQITALGLGASLALLALCSAPARALLRSAGVSPGWSAKLRESRSGAELPRFYRLPAIALEGGAYRRSGPVEIWRNVLADFAEFSGLSDHPYGGLAPVRVSYGPLGFRDELPAPPGGVALVGSSYLEAGYAEARDTVPGQLVRHHGLAASNFGMSFARSEDVLAHLERFVLPTKPAWVVWLVSERFELGDVDDPRAAAAASGGDGSVRAFGRAWRASLWESVARRLAGEPAPDTATLARYRCLYRVAGATQVVDCPPPPPPQSVARSVAALRPVVADMAARVRAAGAELLVVSVPTRARTLSRFLEPVDPAARRRWRRGTPLFRLDNGYERFGEMVRREGVAFLDLTPALTAAAGEGVLTDNPILDRHLSAAGMAIAADEIARALREHDAGPGARSVGSAR